MTKSVNKNIHLHILKRPNFLSMYQDIHEDIVRGTRAFYAKAPSAGIYPTENGFAMPLPNTLVQSCFIFFGAGFLDALVSHQTHFFNPSFAHSLESFI